MVYVKTFYQLSRHHSGAFIYSYLQYQHHVNTRCFIKGPLFVFFIIHSNDDQFTQSLYQL